MTCLLRTIVIIVMFFSAATVASARNITFCGEVIPVGNDFVANRLMDIIRKQIPNANLPALRKRTLLYFPLIQSYLKKSGLPEDLKYLPIVESGFAILTSKAGARGFWQLMPATAQELGLIVTPSVDERDDITKSTIAACKLLVQYYTMIQKKHEISSWVLTAAAYNYGINNIFKAIQNQGKDYFSMNLNPETAIYVYKIIAVKELFEYPEFYMKNFGYNVFRENASGKTLTAGNDPDDDKDFATMEVLVSKKPRESKDKSQEVFVAAHIAGKYKDFKDGDLVSLELDDDLVVQGGFTRKGNVIKGAGWLIDGKIYVDLGYGHDVTLFDTNIEKGLALASLKKGQPVLLKNEIFDDQSQWKRE